MLNYRAGMLVRSFEMKTETASPGGITRVVAANARLREYLRTWISTIGSAGLRERLKSTASARVRSHSHVARVYDITLTTVCDHPKQIPSNIDV